MPEKSLRARAVHGVKWTAVSSVAAAAIQFLQLIILVRILMPDDFGLMGMSMVVLGFGQMFADAGTGAAIIHRRSTSPDQLSSLYWLSIGFGLILWAVVYFGAPLVGIFFEDSRVEPLVRLAALCFLIIPLGQQFQLLLQKELRFRDLATAELAGALAGSVAAVLSALAGQGATSLVIGYLVRSGVNAAVLVVRGRGLFRPRLHFKVKDLRGYLGFGMFQMGEKSINYFQSRADQLIIGKMLGATDLGYYNLAYKLMIQPLSRINPVVNRVLFPVLAKVQDDLGRLKYGYLETRRYLALISFPLLAGLFALAHPLVAVVFGAQWLPAVPVIRIMSFVGMLWVVGNPSGSLILAKGRADLSFWWNVLLLFAMVPSLMVAAPHGMLAICYTVLGVSFVAMLAGPFVVIRRLIPVTAREIYVETLLVPFLYAMSMALPLVLALRFLPTLDAWGLALGVVTGGVIYSILLVVFERRRLRWFLLSLRRA